jgi:hypothetical protein
MLLSSLRQESLIFSVSKKAIERCSTFKFVKDRAQVRRDAVCHVCM